jgi:putative ATPase
MKSLDYGKGYRYAHDEDGGFAAGERYLPDGLAAPHFYRPVERGLEIRIAEKNAATQNPQYDAWRQPRAGHGVTLCLSLRGVARWQY